MRHCETHPTLPPLPLPPSSRYTYYICIYAASIKAPPVYFAGERVQARPRWCIDNAHPRSRDESDFSLLINSISWHERTTGVIMWSAWKWISAKDICSFVFKSQNIVSLFLIRNIDSQIKLSWMFAFSCNIFWFYFFFSILLITWKLLDRSTPNKFAQVCSIVMNVAYFCIYYRYLTAFFYTYNSKWCSRKFRWVPVDTRVTSWIYSQTRHGNTRQRR